MSRRTESTVHTNTSFICLNCGQVIPPAETGTKQRNHCPHCLWSRHMDLKPGDRRSSCRSPMEPVSIWPKDSGEWSLIHRCTGCGILKSNRISGDDNELMLYLLASRAMTNLPFPGRHFLKDIMSRIQDRNYLPLKVLQAAHNAEN